MNHAPPVHVFHEFLPEAGRRGLLHYAVANEVRFVPTKVAGEQGGIIDPKRRISLRLKDLGPFGDHLRERFKASAPAIFPRVGMRPFDIGSIELELVAHNDGAHFGPHMDTLVRTSRHYVAGGSPADRLMSGVYYFFNEPKGFKGGELRLHPFSTNSSIDKNAVVITPAQNSFVVFPAFVTHEVLPVSCPSLRFSDSRFAVNCWYYGVDRGADTGRQRS
jgi:SM-20-related protein